MTLPVGPPSSTRELPIAGVREPTPRIRRHQVVAVIVMAYVVLAAGSAAVGDPTHRWVALHLLLLGGASNAVLVWSRHFAQALLHAKLGSERAALTRLAAFNVGMLAVVLGVALPSEPVAGAGATVVVAAVVAHAVSLVRMRRVSPLPGRLRDAVWFYVAAAAALAVGGTLGGLLATGMAHSAGAHLAMRLAHIHLNLFGWLGLAIIGTEFMLWPAVLRTRMLDAAPRSARRTLLLMVVGLGGVAVGLLLQAPTFAAAALAVYGAGVAVSLHPFLGTARQRPPRTAAAWFLAGSTVWLLVALATDLAGLLDGLDAANRGLDRLVPVLALGVVAHALTGALTFLLPVTIGGGPSGNKRLTRVLETAWVPRLVGANAGLVLLALPTDGRVRTAGWVVAIASLASFAPLAVAAVVSSRRAPAIDASPPARRTVWVRQAGFVAGVVAAAAVATLGMGTWSTAEEASDAGHLAGGHSHDAAGVHETVVLTDFAVEPGVLRVPAGSTLTLTVTNGGRLAHDLRLRGDRGTRLLDPGESETVVLGVVERDETAWCTVAGHRAAGMTLEIRTGGSPAAALPADDGVTVREALSDDARPGPRWQAYDPTLRPAPGGREHRVTLTVEEADVEVAPGVTRRMWTFGGTVPGPVLRGRVGDLFVVRLVNGGTIPHSVDFHASRVAPDEVMRSIEPGGALTYAFRAEHAGAWLYHCGSSPLLQHVGMGMYGAVVIDPPGLPAVDQELVLVQSELHVADEPTELPELTDLVSGDPSLVVFNGYANQYVHAPVAVRPGTRLRIWVVNAGPSGSSAFHVVGAQFDTVFAEGSYELRPGGPAQGGAQALDLGPSQGGFVELVLPAEGRYPFLTHRLADAARGATGLLDAREGAAPTFDAEPHGTPGHAHG